MKTKKFNFKEHKVQINNLNILVFMCGFNGKSIYRWRMERGELKVREGVTFEKDPKSDSLFITKVE